MKIATKLSFAALLGVVVGLGAGFASVPSAFAQMSAIEIGGPSDSSSGDKSAKEPEAVKKVVDKLSTTTKNMSVEDLNAAREAVAKLDVLIDIEKRLNDLADIRAERQEKEGSSIPAPIPAAIIAPPPVHADVGMGFGTGVPVAAQPIVPTPPPAPPVIEAVSMDVDRIIGAAGRYVALVRVAGESQKQIRVGDKISDGSHVDSITPLGVTLSKDKKTRTIKANNSAPLFGAKK